MAQQHTKESVQNPTPPKELLRIDVREKYRDGFFREWEGENIHSFHRFTPAPDPGAVRMTFIRSIDTANPMARVIESTDGGENWAEIPGWHPPAILGIYEHKGRRMAILGGTRVSVSDDGIAWTDIKVPNAEITQYEELSVPNTFSAIKMVTGHRAGRIVMVASYFTGEEGPDCEIVSSTYSDNWGVTWHGSRLFAPPPPLPHIAEGFGEPSVVEMPSGWLWMVFRTEYGELWQTMSRDGGMNWVKATPSGFVSPIANCATMREPTTGATVLCWNAAQPGTDTDFHKHGLYRPRNNLCFAVSHDNTRTWTEPVVIDAGEAQYPTIHFAAGRMFIMYQNSPSMEADWGDMGLTVVAYDTKEILQLPAWTHETIKPWIDRGLIRHWRASACQINRQTIS